MSGDEHDAIAGRAARQAEIDMAAGITNPRDDGGAPCITLRQRMQALAIAQELEKVTPKEQPELLTVAALAEVLSLGESTIRAHDKRGLIPAPRRIGGSLLWSRREIGAWINAGCLARQRWETMKGNWNG
jgi:predicted DNA-binding transcriptional regulator AlpA